MLVRPLPQLGTEVSARPAALPVRIRTISQESVCVITSRPLQKSAVVRCEIPIGDASMKIPTLMHVRWTRKQKLESDGYLSELSFLL
jgi:hypothetical protein